MPTSPWENVIYHLIDIASRKELAAYTDQQLIERYVQQRDQHAFGALVRRYGEMVWNVCWRILGHREDTEDAFQATFTALMCKAPNVHWRDSIEGWMHDVAYKTATKAKIVRARRHAREEQSAKMRENNYLSHESRWEWGEVLDKELRCIPEKYRSPLILCYLEGLTQEAAARRMNIPVRRLAWRLEQGREMLRKRLATHGLDMGASMTLAELSPAAISSGVPPGLIMMLSKGTVKTAAISPQVAVLVKGVLSVGALKMKICLGMLLLTVASVGAGVVKYPSIVLNQLGWGQSQNKEKDLINKLSSKPETSKNLPRVDLYGDPLSPGALARLGTVRFRGGDLRSRKEIVFTPDSTAVGVLPLGKVPRLWDMKTGNPVRQFGDGLRGQNYTGSCLSLDGRRMAYIEEEGSEYHVQEVATGKLIRSFGAQGFERIYCCALSPDGKTLVGYFDGHLCLMDVTTGREIWGQKEKLAKDRGLRSLAFSPDGKIVVAGYEYYDRKKANTGGIELRDARTGNSLRTLGHPWKLESSERNITFSPDSQTLMVVYAPRGERRDPLVYLWDVATGKERWHLDEKNHAYRRPAFSPDNKMVAVFENDAPDLNPEIGLYEVATGKKMDACQRHELPVEGPYRGMSECLTFSPDGKTLAHMLGCLIRCWDVTTRKVLVLPPFGHESEVRSLTFAPDGKTLVSRGDNQAVYVWDSFTGRKRRTLCEESRSRRGRTPSILLSLAPVAVSADGKILAGAQHDVLSLDKKKSASPDQAWEAINASTRANIYIWDATTGNELLQIKLDCSKGVPHLHRLALSPNGKFLAVWWTRSGGRFDIVSLWEVATGKSIGKRIYGAHPVFSPDSTLLMTQRGEKFGFWEAATGNQISTVEGVKFEEWPKMAVTSDWQTLVGIVGPEASKNVEGGKPRWYVNSLYLDKQSKVRLGRARYFATGGEIPNCLAVSPDGKMAAWELIDGVIHVVETATGKERARFSGHSGGVNALCFSPDGHRLASSGEDTTILVWDLTEGWLDERGRLRSTQLSGQQVQQFWSDLAGSDAAQASRAIWTLAAASTQSVPFLTKQLAPLVVKPAAIQRVSKLVEDLDSNHFPVRQKAEAELVRLGEAAEVGMRNALEKPQSAEVRHTLKRLLDAMDDQRVKPSKDMLRCLRATEILEQIGTPEAQRLLEIVGQGSPGAREARAALLRLQRERKQ